MSTIETTNGRPPGTPKFCQHCGTSLSDGGFCPGCGASVHAADHLADTLVAEPVPRRAPPAPEPVRPAADPGRRSSEHVAAGNRHRVFAAVAGGVLVLAIAAIVAFLVVGGSGDGNSDRAAANYSQRLTTAFAPVRSANRELSDQLLRLRGTRAIDARAALRKARQATSLAQGATTVLSAPGGGREFGQRASQMLDRETAYLSAVGAVLSDPSSPSASELQGLASNLTSAISAAPGVAGTTQDVTGADRLTSWALHTRRVIRRRAARRRAAAARGRSNGTAAAPPAPSSSSSASFTACDQNISAKSGTTSCAFAENVFWEYWYFTTSGLGTRFTAYSPSTRIVYEVTCGGASPVVCTTDSGAEIHFPLSAVSAYTQSQADAYAASRDLGPDPTALEGGA